jgi:hypothetical protein
VRLAAEGRLGDPEGRLEGRRVGGVLEGVDDLGAVFVREIQFSWGGVGDVVAEDLVAFVTARLDGDCRLELILRQHVVDGADGDTHGCHFRPA